MLGLARARAWPHHGQTKATRRWVPSQPRYPGDPDWFQVPLAPVDFQVPPGASARIAPNCSHRWDPICNVRFVAILALHLRFHGTTSGPIVPNVQKIEPEHLETQTLRKPVHFYVALFIAF